MKRVKYDDLLEIVLCLMWRRLICLRHDVLLNLSSHLFSIWIIACSDDRLCVEEFSLICRALFRNDQGHIYVVEPGQIHQMFGVFDKNVDGFIDRDEFKFCWNYWIKTVSDWLKIILQAHRPATHSGCLLISPLRAAVSICIESRVDPIWDRIMPFFTTHYNRDCNRRSFTGKLANYCTLPPPA